MRALQKLVTWSLKPQRVTGLSSYYSGVQNLYAPVGLYSSECSRLSVIHDKIGCLHFHRLHAEAFFLCQWSSSSVVRTIWTKGVPDF
jgi:hypothetical protein